MPATLKTLPLLSSPIVTSSPTSTVIAPVVAAIVPLAVVTSLPAANVTLPLVKIAPSSLGVTVSAAAAVKEEPLIAKVPLAGVVTGL